MKGETKMKIIENKIYLFYILLGLFYFVTKIIFYTLDIAGFRALMLGLLATVSTILIGIVSLKEYSKKVTKPIAHYLAIIVPLFILIYTPIYMINRLGIPVFQFSAGKFTILIIFECLAIAQVILAIFMIQKLKVAIK